MPDMVRRGERRDAQFVELFKGCYGFRMTEQTESPPQADQRRLDNMVRRALATPPISNEDILKRSKESRGKWGRPGAR